MNNILPSQTPIEYNKTEEYDIIIENTIRMLMTRGIIENDGTAEDREKIIFDETKKIINNKNDDNLYKIKTTKGIYLIKLLPQKITTKHEFMTENKDTHNIIIVSQATDKLVMGMITEFPNTEIFRENDLKTDKASHKFQPIFILLSKEEEVKYLQEYKIKKHEMAKINFYDPMTRYFNARSGQIFKIIRSSPISITEIIYRVVK